MQKADTPETPWKDSEAKKLLYDAIVSGEVSDDILPAYVYGMRTEYQVFKYENFRTNLRTLRESIHKNVARADDDKVAYHHDERLQAARLHDAPERWDRSIARTMLRQDLADDRLEGFTPTQIWSGNDEYKKFTLPKFRSHLHQEKRGILQSSYWLSKRKKEKKEKESEIIIKGFYK